MCCLVDQRHEGVEFLWPVIEEVVGIFGPLEVDDSGQAVHFGVDGFVHNEAGEKLLRFLKNITYHVFPHSIFKLGRTCLQPQQTPSPANQSLRRWRGQGAQPSSSLWFWCNIWPLFLCSVEMKNHLSYTVINKYVFSTVVIETLLCRLFGELCDQE